MTPRVLEAAPRPPLGALGVVPRCSGGVLGGLGGLRVAIFPSWGVQKKLENPMNFDMFALFLLLSFLCLFCACLLFFLCLGPSGTLKPLFLSIQMLPLFPPKGAPMLPKSAPKASQGRLVWLLCGTFGGIVGQKSLDFNQCFFVFVFGIVCCFFFCLSFASSLPVFCSFSVLDPLGR